MSFLRQGKVSLAKVSSCRYCSGIKDLILQIPQVDIDELTELSLEYGVQSVPVLAIVKDGKVVSVNLILISSQFLIIHLFQGEKDCGTSRHRQTPQMGDRESLNPPSHRNLVLANISIKCYYLNDARFASVIGKVILLANYQKKIKLQ